MPHPAHLSPAARMRLLFDLFETSEAIMRQNLRRRHPGASDAEIELHLLVWLRERPRDDRWGPVTRTFTSPALHQP